MPMVIKNDIQHINTTLKKTKKSMEDCSFCPDPLTNMAATGDSCFWLADFLDSSSLKPFGQMYRKKNKGFLGQNS
jgi:hypothetical protein